MEMRVGWRRSISINLEPTGVHTGAMLAMDKELQAKSRENTRERLGKI